MLIEQEHLTGEPDGDFGPATERAVRAWQKAEGRKQTGIVPLGELVAVAALPPTFYAATRDPVRVLRTP